MENFNVIFSAILRAYEKTKSLDAAIDAATLSDEQKERVLQAFALLDEFDKRAKSLSTAKEQGCNRKKWVAEQLLASAQSHSIEEGKIETLIDMIGVESQKAVQTNIQKSE